MSKICLAFGSNLGNKKEQIEMALILLKARIGNCLAVSKFYETTPVGFHSENTFLNAAAVFETNLDEFQILTITQEIEWGLGRRNKSQNGNYQDRIIDIDIICSEKGTINTTELVLPHPHLSERAFVLEPLYEIAPDFRLPCGDCIEDLYLALKGIRTYSYQILLEDIKLINELIHQLDSDVPLLDITHAQEINSDPNTHIFIVRNDEKKICGMSTLCLCNMISGKKAWLEDVIVDIKERGKGYGKALIERTIREAKRRGAQSFNLTSRPSRISANQLYLNMGFNKRDTNIYRKTLIDSKK